MWQDNNDKIMDILDNLETSDKECFPVVCPVCRKKAGHIFFYRYKAEDERGGMWIWCSTCRHFLHAMCRVPKWWGNLEEVRLEKLASYPDYLEENKTGIDEWVNKLIGKDAVSFQCNGEFFSRKTVELEQLGRTL